MGQPRTRVGLTYGIGEKHATLLRASWSRFADQMGTSMFADAIAGPLLSPFPFAAVRFFDTDGDRQADPTETQSAILGAMGGTVIDPSLDAPLTDEILFGAEHAGVGCFSIGGRLTWRHYRDLLETRPFVRDGAGNVRVATRDDYLPDTVATGSLPEGHPTPCPCSRCARAPARRHPAPRQRRARGRATSAPRCGWSVACAIVGSSGPTATSARRRHRSSRSCSRSTTRPTHWASTTTTTRRSRPESVFADQAASISTADGTTRSAGLYRARAGIGLSILAHGREGYPLLYFEDVLGSDGQTRSVAATNEDSPRRLDNVHQLDVRAEKELGLMGDHAAVTVSLDALNVLNRTPPLERSTRLETATTDFVREIVAPRVFRVGVRVEFR